MNRDITKELQAAVDEVGRKVLEEELEGGVVLIPRGTFTLSEPITIDYDGVAIRGTGKGGATLISHPAGILQGLIECGVICGYFSSVLLRKKGTSTVSSA